MWGRRIIEPLNPQSNFWSVSVYVYWYNMYIYIYTYSYSLQIGSNCMLITTHFFTCGSWWVPAFFFRTFAAAAAIWSEVASCGMVWWWDVFHRTENRMKSWSLLPPQPGDLCGFWGLSGPQNKMTHPSSPILMKNLLNYLRFCDLVMSYISKIACPSWTEHYRGTCGTTGTMGCGVPFLGQVTLRFGSPKEIAMLEEGNICDSMEGNSNSMQQSHVDSWGISWWIERDFLVYPELSRVWFAVWFARKSSTSEMLLIQIPTPAPLPTDLEMTNDLTRHGENHGEASRSWGERRWWDRFFNYRDVPKKTLSPETTN